MNHASLKRGAGWLLLVAGAWAAHAKSVSQGSFTAPFFRHEMVKEVYDHWLAVYLALLSLSLVVGAIAVHLASQQRKEHMRALLNSLVDTVMRTPEEFGDQEYRVTLFRFRSLSVKGTYEFWRRRHELRWPWEGWLVAYARSGEEKLKKCTIFSAPKVSSQRSPVLHGVAGAAWIRGRYSVDNLPSINDISPQADKARYAQATHLTMNELNQRLEDRKSLAPSIWAERIQLSNKRRWGVLVYDSIDPQPIISASELSGHKLGLQALSLVIEEGMR